MCRKMAMSLGVALALGSALGGSCIVSGSTERPHPAGTYANLVAFDGTGCVAAYGAAGPIDSVARWEAFAAGMSFESTRTGVVMIIR